ncbi:MAG: transglutaminase family protein [Syntrophomonadaceae bacterium]|nr:transglutaminase family protein [Syntrophomonadaceae bacterium]
MKMVCESDNLEDYLLELDVVDYNHPLIVAKVNQLFSDSLTEIDIVKTAFEFVRDSISHSMDINSSRITCKASEVLHYKEGICYAKSNLLAAILRKKGIPAGFCYQRLTIGDTPDTGYCIHALNAIYLKTLHRWVRLDARGNKEAVNAQFSIDEEELAFPVRFQYDEHDYPAIYSRPHPDTIRTLKQNTDCIDMVLHHLPTELKS